MFKKNFYFPTSGYKPGFFFALPTHLTRLRTPKITHNKIHYTNG